MTRRKLSDDDSDVWRLLTQSVTAHERQGGQRVAPPLHHPVRPRAEGASGDPAPALPGNLSPAGRLPQPAPRPALAKLDSLSEGALKDMDARTARRLRQGRTPIDAKLDLHGMTQIPAHAALLSFLRRGQGRGWRCVLVITGKGFRGGEPGVLRQAVPKWLDGPDMRPLVVGYAPAQIEDGGLGALYVRLRRTGGARQGCGRFFQ
ncbi:Smr/MutS family protein [Pararhodospirillum photometricum]|uniref:Smr/MutS family protein n=1 Tax=Pararhodospirillum photometricum TaxID=1084 RepID=UPI0002E2CB9D|nr:Smr/MutS family protein [Pararhodospirillum photometricum]